jgi:hypothetical protein
MSICSVLLSLKWSFFFLLQIAFLLNTISDFFRAEHIGGYTRVLYCKKLGDQKNIVAIYILRQLKSNNCSQLEAALIAALPPEQTVERLIKLSNQDKLTWYAAISGLSAHHSFATDLYLCMTVMHSGSEDVRLAGYDAAADGKNGLLLPLAIIDLLRLRPIPVRHSFPYASRQEIIGWYITHAGSHLSWRNVFLLTLCIFLPPQPFCPTP